MFGWGGTNAVTITESGFGESYALFEMDHGAERYVVKRQRLKFFVPESFPVKKASHSFRIFCLGGSTVQGRPYLKETAFSAWLQLSLTAADPKRSWEVINCGGVSYASHRLIPLMRECLTYKPDLVVLCTGHNEFLEDRTYGRLKQTPRDLVLAAERLDRLRIAGLARGVWRHVQSLAGPPIAPASPEILFRDVDAFLDYHNGLKVYRRNEQWRKQVIQEFESNLLLLLDLAQEANVPVLLIRPPSNLRDCAPFKSQHGEGVTPATLLAWTEHIAQARSLYRTDLHGSVSCLKQAIELSPQHALAHYDLGKCYEALGMPRAARAAFLQARELDVCPLRMLAPMETILSQTAEKRKVPLIDAHELLAQRSAWNIPGRDWLLDHVHPTIQGHQIIAGAILKEMVRQGWLKPAEDWERGQRRSYQAHMESLDDLYFLHGQQRLQNLEAWTQGKADGPPIESRQRSFVP